MAENADPTESLVAKLDRIANLMALTLVRGLEESEQIRVLDAVGYTPAQIGAFLGKRPNTVSVALTRQRRKPAARRKPTAKPAARGKQRAARRMRQ